MDRPIALVAEAKSDVHNLPEKSLRTPLAESGQYPAVFSVVEGPIATVVEIRSAFLGEARLRRTIRFYRDSARIDFDTEVEDLPAGVVLSVEFPLAEPVLEVRRGIPYGFSHGAAPPEHATCRASLPESFLRSGSRTIRRPAVAAWRFWIAAFPAGN